MKNTDLSKIIEGCIKKDRASRRALYDLYAPKINGAAYRIIGDRDKAEHVLFETLVEVYLTIEECPPDQFEEWLIDIMEEVINKTDEV